jgi:GMP synthase-like glutamine amidotransferase
MRILVVQNYRSSGLGAIEPLLLEIGATVDLRHAYEGEALPRTTAGYDALIALGGAQNALDDVSSPYFPALLELMRGFTEESKAVLGICLGAQLLARAFGAENRIGAASEFGWCDVALTETGRNDSVLSGLPLRFPIFQWHDDSFDLPQCAARLAENEAAANQAFRIGRATYGVQFHFEADRALVRRWTADFADYLARHRPDWTERQADEEAKHGAAAERIGARIARAWLNVV